MLLSTHSFSQYIKEPGENGEYFVIQQGDNPIAGYANGKAFIEYENVVLFGDHTLSIYKPLSPFFIASDGVKILYSEFMCGMFLFYLLNKYKPESEGYKRHYSIIKEINVAYSPNNEEQVKISDYLSKIDDRINCAKNILNAFLEEKQALLQQFFI